jgi:opacity protein-like surface antigen
MARNATLAAQMKRALFLSILLFPAPMFADDWYARIGAGLERTSKTVVHDVDCASTNPPALFGCGAGIDGRSLGARGDLGNAPVFEIALGTRIGARTRIELALSQRDFELEGNANFRNVTAQQPVHADARSRAAMFLASLDFGSSEARVQPFVSAGIGASRNAIDAVRYDFPAIAIGAATITPDGTNTDLAWTIGGGASVRLSNALRLDLALRYSELGEFRTDAGTATIIRPNRILPITIDRTTMNAGAGGVMVSLRYER